MHRFSDAPSKPEPPNVDKITKDSVTLSWAKPDDGGSKILGYYIEKRMKGAKEWDIINNILHKERTFTVSKLIFSLCFFNSKKFFFFLFLLLNV